MRDFQDERIPFERKRIQRFFKRFFDVIFSLLGLIILSPLFLVVSLMIKLDSRGPVFYRQERLGMNGRVFKIYKFRTMVKDAEKMGSGLFTHENDPRITRVGRFLRRTSIDELPQLINILKGDMSFVGPRPPITWYPKRWNEYEDWEKLRFRMKPGMTGWAQIHGRNEIDWNKRIEYDVWYVKNWSLLLDLKIILETVKVVLSGKGIYGKERMKNGRKNI